MARRFFVNKSGQMFLFTAIGGKRVSSDSSTVYEFSDEEIGKEPLLRGLVESSNFREVDKPKEAVPDQREEIRIAAPLFGDDAWDDENVAQPLGAPMGEVSLDPDRMSRIDGYVPRSQRDQVSIDPRKMSRFLETQESLMGRDAGLPVHGKVANGPKVVEAQKESSKISTMSFGKNDESKSVPKQTQTTDEKKTEQLEVWWCGPANDAGGYGKMNRECIEGLHRKGVKVELDLFKIPDMRCSVPITSSMKEMINNKVSEKAPSVWAVMPPRGYFRSGRKILYTMMETSELPESFADKCVFADEIWLPSFFNMEMFKRSFSNRKEKKIPELYHMPLGVDTELYKPMKITDEQKSFFEGVKTKGFVFLSLFGWSLRKGVDILFKAYLQQFNGDDDVTLLIVSRKEGSSSVTRNQEIRSQISEYISRWNPTNPPHIVHIGEAIPEEKLPIVYNMANCFALPTRGDGFCLPMAEAGSCCVPVISTRCCGQMDFLNDDNSYLVDIEGHDIGSQEIRCLSSYYEKAPFAVLGEKTTNQLKETMEYVVNNYSKAKIKAGKLRENLVNNFTWEHLVDRVKSRLEEIGRS